MQRYATLTQATPEQTLTARLNQLNYLIELGRFAEAAEQWPLVQPLMTTLPQNRTAIYARLNYAHSLACLKAHSETAALDCVSQAWRDRADPEAITATVPAWTLAADELAIAVNQARALEDAVAESYALGELAHLYELTQQWDDAKDLTQQALWLLEGKQAPDIAYRWQWQLGRIYQKQGVLTPNPALRQQGITAYSQAVESLATVRDNLLAVDPQVQFSFRDTVEPVYREFADLLLTHDPGEQPSQADLKRAVQSVDALQLSELENFLGCSISQLIRLGEDTLDVAAAKLYPMLLPERFAIILEIPGQPLIYQETAVTQAEVSRVLGQLRAAIVDPSQTPEVLALGEQVYDWLIAPLRRHWRKTPRLKPWCLCPMVCCETYPWGCSMTATSI
ncbi:MAG: hypothetical protein HC812_03105 [Leptolyngbya sp. RL_3_1]|nr:hypothetical protein [Leptolyngbya sp. RL_3_1]